MHVLNVKDVNDALPRGLAYLRDAGTPRQTRNGPALVAPGPVATVYKWPDRRVLLDATRDANPFFHLFEALWILRGRSDVRFLTMFNRRMADYSDNGHTFHAPYGYRLRQHFGFDQIQRACDTLAANPESRQCVLQIWDPASDLGAKSKDLPCNDTLFLSMRPSFIGDKYILDLTVANRSNDVIWGAYGANAVQFSVLLEYMAAKIGALPGTYTQISNNYHVYTDNAYWKTWFEQNREGVHVPGNMYDHGGVVASPLCRNPTEAMELDADLRRMFSIFDREVSGERTALEFADRLREDSEKQSFCSHAFTDLVLPMLDLYVTRSWNHAYLDGDCDWHVAGRAWVERRLLAAKKEA